LCLSLAIMKNEKRLMAAKIPMSMCWGFMILK
jgi:hypothetical protein